MVIGHYLLRVQFDLGCLHELTATLDHELRELRERIPLSEETGFRPSNIEFGEYGMKFLARNNNLISRGVSEFGEVSLEFRASPEMQVLQCRQFLYKGFYQRKTPVSNIRTSPLSRNTSALVLSFCT